MTKSWGPPTWLFLHTFIEKMYPPFYQKNVPTIIKFIRRICTNLPCSYCDTHARAYMKRLTPGAVPTKPHMQQFLLNFHNDVNKRLGKPQFTNLNLYRRARLGNIFKNFERGYATSTALTRRFSEAANRKRLVIEIQSFLNTNTGQFKW